MASDSKWMQSAVKRPGAFSAKAEKAGMSTQEYARKEAHNPNASTRTKRQANLALTFSGYRGGKRRSKRGGKRA
jgi:hypothetical protein